MIVSSTLTVAAASGASAATYTQAQGSLILGNLEQASVNADVTIAANASLRGNGNINGLFRLYDVTTRSVGDVTRCNNNPLFVRQPECIWVCANRKLSRNSKCKWDSSNEYGHYL